MSDLCVAILAAGLSNRFGDSKLSTVHKGKPLICHCYDALAELGTPVHVVTGGHRHLVVKALGDRPFIEIPNPNFAQGKHTSINQAIQAAKQTQSDLLFSLADLPDVRSDQYQSLVDRGRSLNQPVLSRFAGQVDGPPVFLPHHQLLNVQPLQPGDSIKRRYDYSWIQISEAETDIDRPDDIIDS